MEWVEMTLVLDQIIQSDHFIGFQPMNTLVGPRKSHSGGNIKAIGEEAVKEGIYETAEGKHWARACVNPYLALHFYTKPGSTYIFSSYLHTIDPVPNSLIFEKGHANSYFISDSHI